MSSALAAASYASRAFDSLDYWIFDWRTTLLADRLSGPHPKLALVVINERTIEGALCRSPMDRQLLADLIPALDKAGAHVIALDFIFDQPTTSEADEALRRAVRDAKAAVVLGAIDERTDATDKQRSFQDGFLSALGRPAGYLNIRTELDGVVRNAASPDPGSKWTMSFAKRVAEAYGARIDGAPTRIAWLAPSPQNETFLTIDADILLHGNNRRILSQLKDRIVIIGSDLSDRKDRYPTPLSIADGKEMAGMEIAAHIVAQLVDGRRYRTPGKQFTLLLTFPAALLGFLYGWRFRHAHWPTALPPLAVFFLIDIACFVLLRLVMPFVLIAAAWTGASWAEQWLFGRKKAMADNLLAKAGVFAILAGLSAVLLAMAAPPAQANVIILSSNVKALKPGDELQDNFKIDLNPGDRLRIYLPSGTTRVLEGPYSSGVAQLTYGQTMVQSLWNRVRDFVRTGGARQDQTAGQRGLRIAPLSEANWRLIPLEASGNYCVEKDAGVSFTAQKLASHITISDAHASQSAVLTWTSPHSPSAWPANLQMSDGGRYRISGKEYNNSFTLNLIEKDRLRGDRLLPALYEKGCERQMKLWLDRVR